MKRLLSIFILISFLIPQTVVFADDIFSTDISIQNISQENPQEVFFEKGQNDEIVAITKITDSMVLGCSFSQSSLNELENTQTTSQDVPCVVWSLDGGQMVDQQGKGAGVVVGYLNARYYKSDIGKFVSQDPSFLSIGDEQQTKLNTGKTLQDYLTDPQALNSYGYARNNPIVLSDANGKYWEVSASGTAMGWSGAVGFRFDSSGVNFFGAGGTGAGFEGSPVSVSYTPGELPHTTQSSVSIGGSFAYPVGFGISNSGEYQPSTYSLKNPSLEKSFVVGLGADVYARKEISIPILGRQPVVSKDSILSKQLYWSKADSSSKNNNVKPNSSSLEKKDTSTVSNVKNKKSN